MLLAGDAVLHASSEGGAPVVPLVSSEGLSRAYKPRLARRGVTGVPFLVLSPPPPPAVTASRPCCVGSLQHKGEFQGMMDAAKAGPKCKQLALSELPKYVGRYPELAGACCCPGIKCGS